MRLYQSVYSEPVGQAIQIRADPLTGVALLPSTDSTDEQVSATPVMDSLPLFELPPSTAVVLYPFRAHYPGPNPGTLNPYPQYGCGVQKTTAEGTVTETDLDLVRRIGDKAWTIFVSRNQSNTTWQEDWSGAVLSAANSVYGGTFYTTGLTPRDMAILPNGPVPGTAFNVPIRALRPRPDASINPSLASFSQAHQRNAILSFPMSTVPVPASNPTLHYCRLASQSEMIEYLAQRLHTFKEKGVKILSSSIGDIHLDLIPTLPTLGP